MMLRKASAFILCTLLSFMGFAQEWEIIPNEVTGIDTGIQDIEFINDSTGIAVGGWGFGAGVVIKTTDYGHSWTRTDVNRNLFQICFASDSIVYAVGEGTTVMKSINLGETWTYQNTNVVSPDYQARTVAFLNRDTGFVGLANGPGYAFLQTYDGGINWLNVTQDTIYARTLLQKLNDSTIYAIGDINKLSKSENAGQGWTESLFPEGIGIMTSSMHFFNKNQGLVAVREFTLDCGSHFNIIHTENAGQSWEIDFYPCSSFRDFTFPLSEIGFALGFGAISAPRYMWRSFDSGHTWEELEYPVGDLYYDVSCRGSAMACVDNDTCYIATNYGTIIKMTNASTVGVEDNENDKSDNILVYPNPTSGNISIVPSLSIGTVSSISIYSSVGAKVYQSLQIENQDRIEISVPNLTTGIYILEVVSTGGTYTEKVLKL